MAAEKVVSPSACFETKAGTHIAKVVLMPGDPLRAKYIAETYLENPVLFNDIRGMYGYTGTYKGKEVSVMGSGMGVPSMMIYAHELYSFFGVEAIIRVGSAGALDDDVNLKDVVIAMSASTNSSAADGYHIPGAIAPTANYEMLRTAVDVADELNVKTRVGCVYTSDYFYYPDTTINAKLRETHHLCVEMETAGLYREAMRCSKKALSILSISDHIFKGIGLSPEEIRESFNDMMLISLETAIKCI